MTRSTGATAAGSPRGWQEQASLHTKRATHDQTIVDGRILVCGGFDPDTTPPNLGSVEARRVQPNGTWRTLASMTPRANVAAAELDGMAYVAGGFVSERDADVETDLVEQFDPRTGSWTPSPELPERRAAAGAASLGGLLYVAGGFVAVDTTTDTVVAYDPRNRTWTPVSPMPTSRARLRLVAAGGYLFAIGGQDTRGNTLANVERYEPGSNTWVGMTSMGEHRGVPGVVALRHGADHLIVVVGGAQTAGFDILGFLDSTEVYNLDTDRWYMHRALLPRRKAGLVCAAEVNGTVLAIGGGVQTDGGLATTRDVYALKVTGQDGGGW